MEKRSVQNEFWDTISHTFPDSRPSKSPKPRFEHRCIKGMTDRIESYCQACRQFVAAASNPTALRIAEKAHICPLPKGINRNDL